MKDRQGPGDARSEGGPTPSRDSSVGDDSMGDKVALDQGATVDDARVVDLATARQKRQRPTRTDVASAVASPSPAQTAPPVTFHRRELDLLLRVYGRKVAEGEWRDYAIDFTRERAVFSCFRRASEVPQFRIVKDPRLARKQGAWSVLAANGTVLRRGHELPQVLRVFDRKPKAVV